MGRADPLGRRGQPSIDRTAPRADGARAGDAAAGTRRAYRDLLVLGYLIYGVGAVSPFLREQLSLTDAEQGLHSSAMAIGIVGAGMFADRIDRHLGMARTHALAALVAMVACLVLAWAPALAVTLGAAATIGLTNGLILGHANGQLAHGGGAGARLRLARANFLSMLSALAVPLVIAGAIGVGLGWQLVFVPAIVLLLIAVAGARTVKPLRVETVESDHRLPMAFWLGWLLVVAVVAVEFAAVFWAATLVERRVGASLADAALVASGFYAGMIAGRFGLSLRAAGELEPRLLVRIGLVGALVGALLAWVAADLPVSAGALFICGAGVAVLYPLGVSMALGVSGGHPATAAARVTLASGVAILAAPLVLGALADAVGVETGWLLVPALCVAALALTLIVGRERTPPA